MYTIPLCTWHHRGEPNGLGVKWMEVNVGPSLARQSKRFRELYGTDDELLEKTNQLLASSGTKDE